MESKAFPLLCGPRLHGVFIWSVSLIIGIRTPFPCVPLVLPVAGNFSFPMPGSVINTSFVFWGWTEYLGKRLIRSLSSASRLQAMHQSFANAQARSARASLPRAHSIPGRSQFPFTKCIWVHGSFMKMKIVHSVIWNWLIALRHQPLRARFRAVAGSFAYVEITEPFRLITLFTGRPTREGHCATQTVLFLQSRSPRYMARCYALMFILLHADHHILDHLDFHPGLTEQDETFAKYLETVNAMRTY